MHSAATGQAGARLVELERRLRALNKTSHRLELERVKHEGEYKTKEAQEVRARVARWPRVCLCLCLCCAPGGDALAVRPPFAPSPPAKLVRPNLGTATNHTTPPTYDRRWTTSSAP